MTKRPYSRSLFTIFGALVLGVCATGVQAQTRESLPPAYGDGETYRAPPANESRQNWATPRMRSLYGEDGGAQGRTAAAGDDAYRPNDAYRGGDTYRPASPQPEPSYGSDSIYNRGPEPSYQPPRGNGRADNGRYDDAPAPRRERFEDYGETYDGPRDGRGSGETYRKVPPPYRDDFAGEGTHTYSQGEIMDAGHQFFGSVSKGLASVVQYAFQSQGQPVGYILGEDAGGAFVAGLRYGEGILHTRRFGKRRIYWQGPSLGYDFGAEGSKTMVLIYNMTHPSQLFARFGGVQGSAYLVGGVGMQLQKRGDVTLAPIRSGLGLRIGANVGYLKYTRAPTWNPF